MPRSQSEQCPTCGMQLLRKNRVLLLAVGGAMITVAAFALVVPALLVPAILLVIVGAYLIVWATLGKAMWCRNCKKFPLF